MPSQARPLFWLVGSSIPSSAVAVLSAKENPKRAARNRNVRLEKTIGIFILTSKMPLKDKAGRIIGNFGISRDITVLKQVEDQLAAERNLLLRAANLVELRFVTLADGVEVRVRMLLVNGNEFGAKTKADDCYVYFAVAHLTAIKN